MPTTRSTAASKKAAATAAPERYDDTVKDVVIDVLLKRAFPSAQWAHVNDWIENQSLAPEVREELLAAVQRNL